MEAAHLFLLSNDRENGKDVKAMRLWRSIVLGALVDFQDWKSGRGRDPSCRSVQGNPSASTSQLEPMPH